MPSLETSRQRGDVTTHEVLHVSTLRATANAALPTHHFDLPVNSGAVSEPVSLLLDRVVVRTCAVTAMFGHLSASWRVTDAGFLHITVPSTVLDEDWAVLIASSTDYHVS